MKSYKQFVTASAAVAGIGLGVAGSAVAAPVSVDGVIGAEWAGATVKSVQFNAAAPTSNFGAPTNENHAASYDIYTRGDGAYVYVGLNVTGNYGGALDFANLYFDTNPSTGSDLGFQVTNQNAFIPATGVSTPYTTAADDIHHAVAPGVIEFAVPLSFVMSDPLAMGFPQATSAVQLRLSQSFGYSVAGGTSYGEAERLGVVAVPEPAGLALIALGTAALAGRRRRAGT